MESPRNMIRLTYVQRCLLLAISKGVMNTGAGAHVPLICKTSLNLTVTFFKLEKIIEIDRQF
jgi:hypothetical protein